MPDQHKPQLMRGDLVVIDMPNNLPHRIGKVTGLPLPTHVRVRHWLPNKHRFANGEVTYHIDWLKEIY